MTAPSFSASAALLPGSGYRRSGTAILLTAVSGPIWNVVLVPTPGVSLTVGRLLVAISALLLALDLRSSSSPRPRVPGLVWLLLTGLIAIWSWVAVNMILWGCRCTGEFAGLSELLAVAVLAVLAASFEPRLRPAMVYAVVAGALLSAAMSLGGIEGFTAGMRDETAAHDRVGGPYGNPNYLGFALAFAVPAILALYRSSDARVRLLLGGALGAVIYVLLLSFSRGSLLAAFAGAVAVLVLQRERGRERRRMIAGIGITLVAAVLAYPLFVELRRDATTPGFEAALHAVDRSGWDARAQGLIAGGPAKMVNPSPKVLEVRLSRPDQGVSRAIGTAEAGGRYELRFEARTTSGSQELRYALEDNLLGNGPALAVTALNTRWRPLRLSWTPTGASPDARIYIYGATTTADYQIRDVVTVLQPPGAAARSVPQSVRLRGSHRARLEAARRDIEERDIDSRRVGVELSWEAFTSQPLRGIGWGRFNELADVWTQYGRLPTHNEYLRFLAELGAVGTLLLLLVAAVIGAAVRRASRDPVGLALLGMLTTGAIGLLFVNGLVATSVAIPLAFAAAAACARSDRRVALPAREAGWLHVPALMDPPHTESAWALLRSLMRDGIARARAAPPPLCAAALRLTDDSARVITRLRSTAPAAVSVSAPSTDGWLWRLAGMRWRGSRTSWALGVGALALIVRVPVMLQRHEITPGGDSEGYVDLARNFFSQGPTSVVRPPGYPLFLALADLLPGRLEDAAVVLQLLIGTGLCAGLVFVAWPLFGRTAAVVGGILAAATYPLLSIETLLLADFLFGALVAVAAAQLAFAALDTRWRTSSLVACGVVLACAVYVKPIGHALLLAPVLPLLLATRSLRTSAFGTAVVLATVLVLTTPWMLRNAIKYDSFTMSAQTGNTLFNRVFERDRLPLPTDLPAGRVAAQIRSEEPDKRLSSGVLTELLRRGATVSEANAMQREAAMAAIRRDPLAYAHGALQSTGQMFTDVAAGQGRVDVDRRPGSVPLATEVVTRLTEPLRRTWSILSLIGIASLLWLLSASRPTRVAAAALIAAWGSVAVATAVLHGGQFRYSASLASLTWLLGSAGLVLTLQAGAALVRGKTRAQRGLFTTLSNGLTPTVSGTAPAARQPSATRPPINLAYLLRMLLRAPRDMRPYAPHLRPALVAGPQTGSARASLRSIVSDGFARARATSPPLRVASAPAMDGWLWSLAGMRWRGSRTSWALGVGALALIVRVPVMLQRHEITPGGDSAGYVDLARNFLSQDMRSVVRPPGYPLFLALADLLPGRLEDAAVVLQLLIGTGLCAGLVFVAWPLFGRLAAVVAGLLAAATYPLLSIESLLLADFLFGALVAVAAAQLAVAALDTRWRTSSLVATGVLLACAVYVKPVGLALVLAPALPLLVATRSLRTSAFGTAVVLVTVLVLTTPWMLRNAVKYDSFTMSAQTGTTLFNRVFERDRLPLPTDLPAGRVAAEVRREQPDARLSSGVLTELQRRGATVSDADALQREAALVAIRRAPLRYAHGALQSTGQMFTDVASGRGRITVDGRPGSVPPVTDAIAGIAEPLRRTWSTLSLIGIASLLWLLSASRPTRVAAAALIAVWGTVAVATAVLHGGQFRYSASLAPLTWLLGSAGLVLTLQALAIFVRGPATAGYRAVTELRSGLSPAAGLEGSIASERPWAARPPVTLALLMRMLARLPPTMRRCAPPPRPLLMPVAPSLAAYVALSRAAAPGTLHGSPRLPRFSRRAQAIVVAGAARGSRRLRAAAAGLRDGFDATGSLAAATRVLHAASTNALRALLHAAPARPSIAIDRRVSSVASDIRRDAPALGEPRRPSAPTIALLSRARGPYAPALRPLAEPVSAALAAHVARSRDRGGQRLRAAAAGLRDGFDAAGSLATATRALHATSTNALRALRHAAPARPSIAIDRRVSSVASDIRRDAPALGHAQQPPATLSGGLGRARRPCESPLRAPDATRYTMAWRRVTSRRRLDHLPRPVRVPDHPLVRSARAAAPPMPQPPRLHSRRNG